MISYKIYPSLLDAFSSYQQAGEMYDKFWGFSENPSKTEEEWQEEKLQDFLNSLNRVPFDSAYADMGTAFNEVVDCCVLGRNTDKMKVEKVYRKIVYGQVDNCDPDERWADVEQTDEVIALNATYNGRSYSFPIDLVKHFRDLYNGAMPQLYVEGTLQTMYGEVLLYGYLDELMPVSVHDIKTTTKYEPWKFKGNAQHLVYPHCLKQMGCEVESFVYDVAELRSDVKKHLDEKGGQVTVTGWDYYREEYGVDYGQNECLLRERVEEFIGWIEEHRELIDNPKLFGA